MSSRRAINLPKKRVKRLKKSSSVSATKVMKMVMAMSEKTPDSNGDIPEDFLSTGRTGRRNALADVLSEDKRVTTSDLPCKMELLTTSDDSKSNNKETGSRSDQNSHSRDDNASSLRDRNVGTNTSGTNTSSGS